MLLIHLPNVEAELARLLLRSTLEMESEAEDLIESLLSSISDEVELDPSELFLFTVVWNEFLILSNKDKFSSSGSISITSFGGKLCIFSAKYVWNRISGNDNWNDKLVHLLLILPSQKFSRSHLNKDYLLQIYIPPTWLFD